MAHRETDVTTASQASDHGRTQDDGSREIKAQIDSTRRAMDRTLDKLADRLSPRQFIGELLGFTRPSGDGATSDRLRAIGQSAMNQAKKHPMPSALIAAGVVWLMMEGDDRRRRAQSSAAAAPNEPGLWDQAKEKATHMSTGIQQAASATTSKVSQTVRDKVTTARARVTDGMQQVGGQLHQVGDQLQAAATNTQHALARGYQYTRQRTAQALDQSPLSLGMAALAAGMLVGFALPRTRMEDELYGEQAEQIKDRAKEMGREALDRGKEVGTAAVQAVKEQAQQQGLTTQALGEKIKQAAQTATDTAKRELQGENKDEPSRAQFPPA